jgi:phasin family protein
VRNCRTAQIHVATHHASAYVLGILSSRTDLTMNPQFGKQAYDQLLKGAHIPENVQAIAQKGVAASQEFYIKTAAAAQDGTKAFTELADAAWGSTKILNEKAVQNVTANLEAAFAAAHEMATAKSLPEIGKIQVDYLQKLAARATEQTKEFVDLSTRTTQHLFEKAQAAGTKSFKSPL